MDPVLTSAFALVCGQHAAHTWTPGGLALPCCQRCTGLYVGALGALLLHAVCKPPPTARWQWLHGMFLLQMVPFGFHWLPQGPVLRTETGVLFGFGLVAFLWPLAANLVAQICNPFDSSPACGLPIRAPADWKSALRHRRAGYVFGLAATLVFIPVAAMVGGQFGFLLLSWLAALGALGLAGLVLLNVASLGSGGVRPSERRVPA